MHRLYASSLAALLLVAASGCADEEEDPRGVDSNGASANDGGDELLDDEDDDAPLPRDAGRRGADAGLQSSRDAGHADGGAKAVDASKPVVDAGRPATAADAGPVASAGDVPAGDHCAQVAAWDAQSAQFEQEVLKLTNEARAAGHNCDKEGNFGPTTPLTMNPALRCSSRLHSQHMATTGEFAHETAAGSTPSKRMAAAGYKGSSSGENIAAGQSTPKQVVDGWLDSDGHCRNIMTPGFTEIGVGYVVGKPLNGRGQNAPYWTQNFGSSGGR
jgi:uncharacterized protein YkwD